MFQLNISRTTPSLTTAACFENKGTPYRICLFTHCDVNFADGMAAVDPSSDWNAPAEHWGNYEEPPVSVTIVTPPLKELPLANKVYISPQSNHTAICTHNLSGPRSVSV